MFYSYYSEIWHPTINRNAYPDNNIFVLYRIVDGYMITLKLPKDIPVEYTPSTDGVGTLYLKGWFNNSQIVSINLDGYLDAPKTISTSSCWVNGNNLNIANNG